MKKIILLISFFLFTTSVYAATATPTATITTTSAPDTQQKLDALKDRLASAATQLHQSQKRAIFGTVKTTSVSTITVATTTSDIKIELTDKISVFQIIKGKRTELTTDQVSKNDEVVVFGDYDTNLDILRAQVIFIQDSLPKRISGRITEISKSEYTITIATLENISYVVDYEKTTKNFYWTRDNGVEKAGFSQLLVGDIIHVLETPAPKVENRVSAIRILDIGPPAGEAGNLIGETPTATATPTP